MLTGARASARACSRWQWGKPSAPACFSSRPRCATSCPRPRPTPSTPRQPELFPKQPIQPGRPSEPAAVTNEPPSPPPTPKPVYKKWWFWTAILGSAAVVGTVAGVLAYKPWELPASSNIHNVGDRL